MAFATAFNRAPIKIFRCKTKTDTELNKLRKKVKQLKQEMINQKKKLMSKIA